jgi:hypothetical protein
MKAKTDISQQRNAFGGKRTPIQIAHRMMVLAKGRIGHKLDVFIDEPEYFMCNSNIKTIEHLIFLGFVAGNDTSNGECRFTTLPPSYLNKTRRRIKML